MTKVKSLVGGSFVGILGSAIYNVLRYLINVILARYLGPSAYGIYSIVNGINTIAHKIGALGLPQGIIKFVVESTLDKSKFSVRQIFWTTLYLNGLLTILIVFFFTLFPEVIAINLYSESALIELLKISAFLIPINILILCISNYLLAVNRIDLKVSIEKVFIPLTNILVIGLVVLIRGDLRTVYLFILIANSGALLLALALVWKQFPEIFKIGKIKLVPCKILAFSVPTFLTGISYVLMQRLDVLMLGYFSDAEYVGIYNISSRTSEIMTFFIGSMLTFFGPVIVELYTKNKILKLSKYYGLLSKWIIILTVPVFLILLVYSKDILHIVGANYVAGYIVLLILASGQLVNAATGPVGLILKMTGYQNVDMINGIIMLVSNVVLNLILIPEYGMYGAAAATFISLVGIHLARIVEVLILIKLKASFSWLADLSIYLSVISVASYYFIYNNTTGLLMKTIFFGLSLIIYGLMVYTRLEALEKRYFSMVVKSQLRKMK